eukprot:GHVT01073636.1.p1 GENE.GHVT01073636.1~~GHVT01073636.1.p1  ORF type:complete len:103 (-),score=7.57 GHVT01073636.1:289-597(-)
MHKWPQGRGGSGILQCIRYGGSSCHSDKRAPRGKAQLALDDANLLLLHDGGDQQLLLVHDQWGSAATSQQRNWDADKDGGSEGMRPVGGDTQAARIGTFERQ